jgi:sec-independent protein translocase protein TatA
MSFIPQHLAFLQNMGVGGMVLIGLVVVLLFGGRKIPELMRGLGEGMKEFKDATKDGDDKSIDDKK